MLEITIIDDEKTLASMLAEVAQMSGYKALVFNDASEFLKHHELSFKKETDVIFLDLTMPDIDGIEVITELGRRECQSVLVLMSGFDMELLNSTQQLAQEYGLNVLESLSKPMDIAHIKQLLEKIKNSL